MHRDFRPVRSGCWFLGTGLLLLVMSGCSEPEPEVIACPAPDNSEDARKTQDRGPRIAVLRIELDSVDDAARRLDRIGADWEFVPPDIALDALKEFDVAWFPSGWGKLAGLAGLAETYSQYALDGGGIVFSSPGTDGNADQNPALQLLPHAVTVKAYPSGVGPSVVSYSAGDPHPLVQNVRQEDLPYLRNAFSDVGDGWRVVARAEQGDHQPTLLVAEVGMGKVLLHAARDDYGHHHNLSDRFVVRMLGWLASEPEPLVTAWKERFGPRKYSDTVLELDRDYQRLVSSEADSVRAALERADSLLRNEAQHGSTWTEYHTALNLVHRHRSKAAIPLFLKLLLDEDVNHGNFKSSLIQAFTLLTGEVMPSDDPAEITRDWWQVRQHQITVDQAEMSEVQKETLVAELLRVVARIEPMGLARTPPFHGQVAHGIVAGGYRVYARDYRQTMHKALVPVLLRNCDSGETRWLTPGPLAACFKMGLVPGLPTAVGDRTRPTAARVVAAVALYRAGANQSAEVLLRLAKECEEVDLQQAMVVLLADHIDDSSAEVVLQSYRSAVKGLQEVAREVLLRKPRPQHAEPLGKMIRSRAMSGGDLAELLELLQRNHHSEAAAVEADLIALFLRDYPQSKELNDLVQAFQYRVNAAFGEENDSPDERARAALAWWDEHQAQN